MNSVLQDVFNYVSMSDGIDFDKYGTGTYSQFAIDNIVEAYVKNYPGFIDEALESALTLLEQGDEAIRAARVREFQDNIAGLVGETAQVLGMRISRKIEDYAMLQFRADYEGKLYELINAEQELH